MIIEEEVLESSAAASAASRRQNRRHAVAMGLATLPIAGATVFAVRVRVRCVRFPGCTKNHGRSNADKTLLDEQPIAEPNQVQAPRSRDDVVRDLVERGLVPAATLDDGTQITGPGRNRHGPATTWSETSSNAASSPPPPSTTEPRSPDHESPVDGEVKSDLSCLLQTQQDPAADDAAAGRFKEDGWSIGYLAISR